MSLDSSGPYISFAVATSTLNDTFTMERGLTPTGPWVVIRAGAPLLEGRAVIVDTTAPLETDVWYRFTVEFGATLEEIVGPFQTEATGMTWLSDPTRPWADIGMDVCPPGAHALDCATPDPAFVWGGFTDAMETPVDATLLDILNAERPADTFARRKFANWSFRFFTLTLDAIDQVYELFTAGGPLMLRTPPVYGWGAYAIQPGTPQMTFVSQDQRRPLRQWDVPFTVVDMPVGPVQGTDCNNWCAVEEAFPTFAELTAYPATWLELLHGDVLCPDTPPGEDGFGMGPFGDGPFGDGG